ncbi:MAG TPA: YciI family protein [Acidimicrobiia bacterium]|nr:YciI family protein [Acidimicrobiia bacterium]
MPKYAALIYAEETPPESVSPEEQQQVMADYMEFGNNAEAVIRGGEALHDSSTATTVHVEGGKGGRPVVTDGPFAETKEVLGGLYLLETADLDEALKWAQQIPGAWHGRVEVRPIMEFDENGQQIG